MSWTNPGRVKAAERVPPPTVAAPSPTRTEYPPRARATAAPRPFGPDPTMTASYLEGIKMVPAGPRERMIGVIPRAASARLEPCRPQVGPPGLPILPVTVPNPVEAKG